jgi:hypothetical protein
MNEHTFLITLGPTSIGSSVFLDDKDISKILRGIKISAGVGETTTVELIPSHGHRAELMIQLPEAQILIAPEPK